MSRSRRPIIDRQLAASWQRLQPSRRNPRANPGRSASSQPTRPTMPKAKKRKQQQQQQQPAQQQLLPPPAVPLRLEGRAVTGAQTGKMLGTGAFGSVFEVAVQAEGGDSSAVALACKEVRREPTDPRQHGVLHTKGSMLAVRCSDAEAASSVSTMLGEAHGEFGEGPCYWLCKVLKNSRADTVHVQWAEQAAGQRASRDAAAGTALMTLGGEDEISRGAILAVVRSGKDALKPSKTSINILAADHQKVCSAYNAEAFFRSSIEDAARVSTHTQSSPTTRMDMDISQRLLAFPGAGPDDADARQVALPDGCDGRRHRQHRGEHPRGRR